MTTTVLKATDLCKTFSNESVQQHVLKNLNLEIRKGDFTVIMGDSGAGKSTLLYSLSGMDRPSLGAVLFGNEDISNYSNDKLAIFRRKHCGFVFQQNYLNDTMSVLDNIIVSGLLKSRDRKAIAARAKELLKQVGLDESCYNKFPNQLSGGEKQRVALVRSVINEPEILFADEPTGALNSQNTAAVLDILTEMNRRGQSIVMVTHTVAGIPHRYGVVNMNSLFFIAKNNIKKHKGEVAILFTLIFISALLLFSSLSLMMSATNTINECDEKYHVADLMAFGPGISLEDMEEDLKDVEGIERADFVPMIATNSDYYYKDMTEADSLSYQFYFFDASYPTYLNAFPEEFKDLKDDEIVLPYYMSYTVNAGDNFKVKLADKTYAFKVRGFVENLYFATSMNITGYYSLVNHKVFDEMKAKLDPTNSFAVALFKTKEGTDLHEFDLRVQNAFPGDAQIDSVDRDTMNIATTGMTNIATSIVLIFTIMLIVMAVIIMHFSIKNFIELNVQNIGLLQATGYTAKELRFACVMEQLIIGMIATVMAIAAGIFLSKPLSSLSGMMMGLSGFSGISIPALIATLIGIPVMVFIGSMIATTSYKKLTVLEALRSGITAHNFKKNHFPLETSRLPLNLAMAGKNIFGSHKKSIFITVIVAGLAFSTCLGFTLFQNWALDQSALLKLVGFESSDLQAHAPGDNEFVKDMRNNPEVESINTWTTLTSTEVTYLNNSTSLGIDVYGDVNKLRNE